MGRSTGVRRACALAVLALAMLAGSSARAATFQGTFQSNHQNPDLLGTGAASAQSTQSAANGNVTANASASSNAPAGTTIEVFGQMPIGSSWAESIGGVTQILTVNAGQVVTVTINNVAASANGRSFQAPMSGAISSAYALAEFFMYTCTIGNPNCFPSDTANSMRSLSSSLNEFTTVPASVSLTYVAAAGGNVLVRAGLGAEAYAQGLAADSASAASGTVASITAA